MLVRSGSLAALASAPVALLASALACGTTTHAWGSDAPPDASADVLEEPESFDAGFDAGAFADAGPPLVYLRIAHASPDTEALDVCATAREKGAPQGPLLAAFADDASVDGGSQGVSFGQVTRYFALAPGTYDLTWIPAGQSTCASALGDAEAGPGVPASTTPALASGDYATVLLAGDRTPAGRDAPLSARVLMDDAALAGGGAAMRAVNAWPSVPSLDLGLGVTSMWVALFVDVPFGAAGTRPGPGEGTPDGHGYLPIAPAATTTLSAKSASADAGSASATTTGVTIDQGSLVTVFAIGGKTGDSARPPSLLVCADNGSTGGLFAPCLLP